MTVFQHPLPPAPAALRRKAFWTYCEVVLGLVEADALSEIDAAASAGALTPVEAVRARRAVTDATEYERLDPLLLDMARLLGLAIDQAALDAHFRAARDF